ncbi:MAG: fumarylacetoacetate hydrolase family protein [Acidimicrobiaceae bacterium]|nr:fumarylacetoacetate hydrolase family protein [Acidimicrobiaceae bacterium]
MDEDGGLGTGMDMRPTSSMTRTEGTVSVRSLWVKVPSAMAWARVRTRSSAELKYLVAYASDHEMLHPGDVLGTGTIGTSCSRDTKRWIKVGQRARFEVDGLGTLDLPVVAQPGAVDYVRNGMDGLMSPPVH